MRLFFPLLFISLLLGSCSKYERVVEYFESGEKYMEGYLKEGKKHGKWIWWFSNGTKQFEGDYKDGKQHGLFQYYHGLGHLDYEIRYKNNLKEGKSIHYYEDGTVKLESNYVNDVIHGHYITFWENAMPYQTGWFKWGEKDSLWTRYYREGGKRMEGIFRYDVQVGEWTWWDDDGIIARIEQYQEIE